MTLVIIFILQYSPDFYLVEYPKPPHYIGKLRPNMPKLGNFIKLVGDKRSSLLIPTIRDEEKKFCNNEKKLFTCSQWPIEEYVIDSYVEKQQS